MFASDFVERIADTRNLMCAAEHLARNGDKSAGPNGQHLHRLLEEDPASVWQELRRLSREVLDGTYQPGPSRRVYIPKSSGNGMRPVDIFNWQDQVVQRGIVQLLDPFVDHLFDELSLGYRAGHDRFEAIAKAGTLMELEGRYVVIAADLESAFTRVPHAPLLTEVERHTGNSRLRRLIERIIKTGHPRRGVSQGGAISAFLLNLFLDRYLDRPWRRQHADIPLIRVADDLLILCRSVPEAVRCRAGLQQILLPTGMSLNTQKSHTRQLASGQQVDWLGLTISVVNGGLRTTLTEGFYDRVERKFRETLEEPDGALLVGDVIQGTLDQLGPCLLSEQPERVLCHLARLAADLGYEELPPREDLRRTWEYSAARYLAQCQLWRLVYRAQQLPLSPATGDGSANRQFPAYDTPQLPGGGLSAAGSSSPSESPCATLTVTCTQTPNEFGAWAYHVTRSGHRRTTTKCGIAQHPNLIRAALTALLFAVRVVRDCRNIRVVTDSAYLCDEWPTIVSRQRRLWSLTGRQSVPPNWDLLSALDRELGWRQVRFERLTANQIANHAVTAADQNSMVTE